MGRMDRRSLKPSESAPAPPIKHAADTVAEAPIQVALGDTVWVKTGLHKIGGQQDHAAIVTRVRDPDTVDVLLIAAGEMPRPVDHVPRHGAALRWRPRS